MQETPQQYTGRILGYQQGKVPMKVLASSPGKLKKLLKGASQKKLFTRPGPGKWPVSAILAHMADTELVFGFRMRLTLGSNGTPIQAFDQDVWADYSHYAKQDPAISFEAYRALRERNIRLLKVIPAEMREFYGMHDECHPPFS